ncbi:hypothetical protein FQ707_02830 [Bacteroidaceae bacterium HV4-6-C5C]|nr:hypothetical protein FQ707_02830 [Bacteroidaceae bacterium HV4-6-C5C]
MKRIIIILLLATAHSSFAQNRGIGPDTIYINEVGPDSIYEEYLKLVRKQGLLSDCEFGMKNANDDFNKQNYIYYSKELVGACVYCNVLQRDYGVKWRFFSDLFSDEYYNCYNKEISHLLIRKYGFDIFKKTAEKVDSLFEIRSTFAPYYVDSCIPNFIKKNESVYIHDPYIQDTLKVRFRVEIDLKYPLSDKRSTTLAKSVRLIDLDIHSINSKNRKLLSRVIPIDSPYDKYIWDLCSAKIVYWYMYQPYDQLPEKEKIKYKDMLYMTAILYLIPEKYNPQ